jgi:predicted AlkP superfamily pyrophosphatase or phosphodiesterase
LALLHIIHVDHTEHVSGPRTSEAYAAIKAADGQVREIWEELKRDFPGKATLLVVSDHGFSPIHRVIRPNIVLGDAGLIEVKGDEVVGGAARVIIQGGSALVYVDKADPAAAIDRVKKAFDGIPEIAKIVGPGQMKDHGLPEPKDDPHAPDLILFAKEGSSFAEAASGDGGVIDEPASKGTHGHDENLPNLQATFIAWGAGIKPGAQLGPISNTQVAPTIAKLLGLSFPSADGKPLTALLVP